jgi:phospholipid-binding lipoprotein MlaA
MKAITIKAMWRPLALAIFAVALTGCATTTGKIDPYEKYNRKVFAFNDAVDTHALKPAATAYKRVLPGVVQTGVNNFFYNLSDVWSSANNLMQGKGERGLSDMTRVVINSTFGLAGLLDIATDAGLPRHTEDFGQTLGYWGVPPGPYVMLPLLGPSTLRDTVGLPLDIAADPWGYGVTSRVRNLGTVLRVVDQRAVLLDASTLLEAAALGDRYEFIRDGYLQQRKSKVFDGEISRKAAKEARADEEPDARGIAAPYVDTDPDAVKKDSKANLKAEPITEPITEPKAEPKADPVKPVSSETPAK